MLTGNENDNLAFCDQCRYASCKKCKKTYHSQTLCGRELELADLKRKRKEAQAKMEELGLAPDNEEVLLRELLAVAIIENTTRLCPNRLCQVPIEKNDGCDHMYCIRCQQSFHWREATIQTTGVHILNDRYDGDLKRVRHALNGELNADATDDPALLRAPVITELLLKRTKKCPYATCAKLNMKHGKSNYLICQFCKRGFCFLCGRPINGKVNHFARGCEENSSQ